MDTVHHHQKELDVRITDYSLDEYLHMVKSFHGSVAPGMVIGGFMVDLALKNLPKGEFFDAICETRACLPDAIQLLTPCTIGNGWLKIMDFGRYALSMFEKWEGEGIRVFIDSSKIKAWPEINSWFFKLKPKKEQDYQLLLDQIVDAGPRLCSLQKIKIRSKLLNPKLHGDRIASCPLCGEAYRSKGGAICPACQGETPYRLSEDLNDEPIAEPHLKSVPVEHSNGLRALHDMTQVVPGTSKGPIFKRGQTLTAGDICRLQKMGRRNVYVAEENEIGSEWVHEDEASLAFAQAMAGEGVKVDGGPREGKITLLAEIDGMLVVDTERMEQFNMVPGVMCASRKSYRVVDRGHCVAGTRAIPLFLPQKDFQKAISILGDEPLFRVLPMHRAKVGILSTGSEVFQGLIEDKFIPIIKTKVEKFGCSVIRHMIVPDDREFICREIKKMIRAGVEIVVTTAGLSVDPDDVTRQGIRDAGATDMLYGAPILPGAMTLLAKIDTVRVMGVPACALYYKTTSFDLLLPRVLAGLNITRHELAKLGHGAMCLDCKTCTYQKCTFGT